MEPRGSEVKSMNDDVLEMPSQPGRLTGRDARTQSIATRFTREEERTLLKRAEARGQNLREWAREVLLRSTEANDEPPIQMHIFTELVAIELVLMNVLEPLLRGENLSPEQIAQLFREVQATKAARAQQILRKRTAQTKEA
jgi:hypothetical protein